ncbi:phage tail tape measure protein [Gellertiella hungarica]|uniref:TP901 family phage tail tape measure protein n=1 Tax=Gellertiella hungarica TaxID=1572859 RepID=A0A7W6NLK9_9HYPH|nr:phage tail tape measure protein [Gellertiella hungarica]MBB4065694.1 TP901 family phage tail tape measure protein [Gellertiella hungarica]
MKDLDVSLRLRMVNQLSRPANEAERDLKDIKEAADRIGRSNGADRLNQDIRIIGRTADNAQQSIRGIGVSLQGVAGDARGAATAIGRIKTEATEVRSALSTLDNGSLNGLKSDAANAKQAITEIGAAADAAQAKLRQLKSGPLTMTPPGGRVTMADGPWRPHTGGLASAAEGALDQFGAPVALGAGGAYLVGAVPAAVAVAGGEAIRRSAADEFTLDQIQNTGGFSDEEKKRYDFELGKVGAKYGVGKQGAMQVFGSLQAGGMEHEKASAMMESVLRFAKATGSDPVDAAKTATALSNHMKISAEGLMAVFDMMAVGGKEGMFEIPDMAKNFPSMLAALAVVGSKGPSGVALATAMIQSINNSAGSPDQAKTSFEAMLGDMLAPEVTDRAKKDYGIDAFAIQTKAKEDGEDPTLALIKAYKKAVGGDQEKMRSLFRNSTSFGALAAVFKDLDAIEALMKKMEDAKGTIDKDFGNATDNLSSQSERLSANVGQDIKDLAAPLLPYLTSVARFISQAMEDRRENPQKDPLSLVPNAPLFQEGIRLWLQNTSSKPKGPSLIDRFLYGKAADPEFDAKKHFGIDLRPSAESSMQGYTQGLAEQGAKAEQEAQGIAERIKALLGFTVSPVIAPTYVDPGAAAAPAATPAPATPSQKNTFNQTITSPNSKHAAVQSAREIRRAQARTLYDTGRRLA